MMRFVCAVLMTLSFFVSSSVADDHTFLGTATCASSNCHGSAKPLNASPIPQNEFFIWFKHDKHSQAYKALLSEDARRIASNLKIGDPEKESMCLDCHATNPAEKLRGDKYSAEDGVGCESCHGAASSWIKSHVERGATHEKNVEHGMREIVPAVARATLCTECHFGTDKKELSHKLYGAGHPRVGFEMDTYEAVMPRHWVRDSDYETRKGPYSSTRAWLAGQYALSKRFLEKLSANPGHPDFSLYSCYSCHHDIARKEFLYKNYGAPGEPPLNYTHLEVLGAALETDAGALRTSLDSVKTKIAGFDASTGSLKKVLRSLLTALSTPSRYDFQFAEQAVMGVSAVTADLDPSGTKFKKEIDALYASVKEAGNADPLVIKKRAGALLSRIK